jgi:hypothetical protein
MNSILNLLNSDNYQVYNRQVARALKSVNAAIMLSELINRYQYHEEKNALQTFKKYEGEWFYYTVGKCEERTVLSEKEQMRAVKILEKLNLIKRRQIGIPARRHFQLNIKEIVEFVESSKNSYSSAKREELEPTKGRNSNLPKGVPNKEPYKEPNEELYSWNHVNYETAKEDSPSPEELQGCKFHEKEEEKQDESWGLIESVRAIKKSSGYDWSPHEEEIAHRALMQALSKGTEVNNLPLYLSKVIEVYRKNKSKKR